MMKRLLMPLPLYRERADNGFKSQHNEQGVKNSATRVALSVGSKNVERFYETVNFTINSILGEVQKI